MTPAFVQTDLTHEKPADEFSMGQRQIAALGFVAFLLLGLVATLAYVAGRVARPQTAAAARVAPPSRPAVAKPARAEGMPAKPAVEQLIVVEPVAAAVVAPRPTAAPPVATPVAKAPELKPVEPALLAGNTFWQVAATELGMAEVTCEFLTRKGLPALLGDSPSPGVVRVLVGPVKTPDENKSYKAVLDASGFHPFIKKY